MKTNWMFLFRSRGWPALALVLALAGCSRGTGPTGKGSAPVPVLVAKAVGKSVPVQIRAIGNVTPYSRVTIRSQITGQLREVHFQEGQAVRKGDLLFSIDPRPAQTALAQAQANLARDTAQMENARIQFGRVQKLVAEKIASQDVCDTSKANLDALAGTVAADHAAVSNALLNLEYTTLRSPVDGMPGAQLVYAGGIIKAEEDEMVVIHQIQPLYVSFAVPERHLPKIKKELRAGALKVAVDFAGLNGDEPAGKLTFVDNAVDSTTGMIQLKATFANADDQLWPGQFVQVVLTLTEHTNALVVPSQAIQTGQNGEYAFVVNPDQSVALRPVKTGETTAGETIIASGLSAGEMVVTDGQLRLVAGARVSVKSSLGAGVEAQQGQK